MRHARFGGLRLFGKGTAQCDVRDPGLYGPVSDNAAAAWSAAWI